MSSPATSCSQPVPGPNRVHRPGFRAIPSVWGGSCGCCHLAMAPIQPDFTTNCQHFVN